MGKPWYNIWPEKVPKTLDYPEAPLHEFIDSYAKTEPDAPFLIYEDRKVYTYSKVSEDSDRISAALWEMGVRKGDAIAIVMFNKPEFIPAFFGGLKTGARVATIDPLTTGKDLELQLSLTEPKVVFTDSEVWEREKVTLEDSKIKNLVVVDGGNGVTSYEEILATYKPQPPELRVNPREDVAVSVHYAGIIGRTYEVYHTHYNFVACMFAASILHGLKEGDASLIAIPLSHLFGLGTLIESVIINGKVVLMKRFDANKALELIKDNNVNFWPGPPQMFESTLPDIKREDVSSLKLCLTGAAVVPPELQKTYFEELSIPLVQGYGCTEALYIAFQPPHLKVYGTVGIPLPDVDIKVVDKEAGKIEVAGGEGELIVKSPWIMKGYGSGGKIDAVETRKAIRDGWLYTGDLFNISENGLLYFHGIKKRFLKYKGYPIFPRDLEILLEEHPAVEKAFVDGEWDPKVGHKVFAKVVLKDEYRGKISEEELMDFINKRVTFYKKIRKIEFVRDI